MDGEFRSKYRLTQQLLVMNELRVTYAVEAIEQESVKKSFRPQWDPRTCYSLCVTGAALKPAEL